MKTFYVTRGNAYIEYCQPPYFKPKFLIFNHTHSGWDNALEDRQEHNTWITQSDKFPESKPLSEAYSDYSNYDIYVKLEMEQAPCKFRIVFGGCMHEYYTEDWKRIYTLDFKESNGISKRHVVRRRCKTQHLYPDWFRRGKAWAHKNELLAHGINPLDDIRQSQKIHRDTEYNSKLLHKVERMNKMARHKRIYYTIERQSFGLLSNHDEKIVQHTMYGYEESSEIDEQC